jgi:hypothetical protein
MNMVQIIYTHVSKCKNDTCWNFQELWIEEMKESSGMVNSSMVYLIHCKNLHKYSSVPPPSTTIIKILTYYVGGFRTQSLNVTTAALSHGEESK